MNKGECDKDLTEEECIEAGGTIIETDFDCICCKGE